MKIILYRAVDPETPAAATFAGSLATRSGEPANWYTSGPTAEAVQDKLNALAERERKALEGRPPRKKKADDGAEKEPVQAAVGVVEDPGDVV